MLGNNLSCFGPCRRTSYKYGEGKDALECAMSYSGLGEHMEQWCTFAALSHPQTRHFNVLTESTICSLCCTVSAISDETSTLGASPYARARGACNASLKGIHTRAGGFSAVFVWRSCCRLFAGSSRCYRNSVTISCSLVQSPCGCDHAFLNACDASHGILDASLSFRLSSSGAWALYVVWSHPCTSEPRERSPARSTMKFSFYSVTFAGGRGTRAKMESVEVWGPEGVYARDEHFVVLQVSRLL